MEPREYGMDRHKTKSNFKRQRSKVINREPSELWLKTGPTAEEHMPCFCCQSQLWPRKDLETLQVAACAKKGHSAPPPPFK